MKLHKFTQRIRLERDTLKIINGRFSDEEVRLSGMSSAAINLWFEGLSDLSELDSSLAVKVKSSLELIGKLIRAESGCSHRGAMLATTPSFEVAIDEINRLNQLLSD